ncbi:MAG: hypothetical protein RIS64_4508, partial [Bacteroidota bacterium]
LQKKIKNQNHLSPTPSSSGVDLKYFFTAHLLIGKEQYVTKFTKY